MRLNPRERQLLQLLTPDSPQATSLIRKIYGKATSHFPHCLSTPQHKENELALCFYWPDFADSQVQATLERNHESSPWGRNFLSRAEDDNPSPGEEKTEACPELVSQAHTSKAWKFFGRAKKFLTANLKTIGSIGHHRFIIIFQLLAIAAKTYGSYACLCLVIIKALPSRARLFGRLGDIRALQEIIINIPLASFLRDMQNETSNACPD